MIEIPSIIDLIGEQIKHLQDGEFFDENISRDINEDKKNGYVELIRFRCDGLTMREIGEHFQLSKQRIHQIFKGLDK